MGISLGNELIVLKVTRLVAPVVYFASDNEYYVTFPKNQPSYAPYLPNRRTL